MTTPIPGAGAAGAQARLPAGPLAPAGTVAPVRSVATDGPLDPAASRSGIDLRALLTDGADLVQPRDVQGAVALAEMLETARGALVRGDPHAMLAALDAGWDGVDQTESGWYFRGAALALLGLPGEAARVLADAAPRVRDATALHFLDSLVRDARHDAVGARLALTNALARAPDQPLLRVWESVLMARHGDRAGALSQLARLGAALGDAPLGDAPLLQWGRLAITRAHASALRAGALADANAVDARFVGSALRYADAKDGPRALHPASPAPTEFDPDAPDSDVPRTDAPRTDAPRTDAPRTDAPRTDAPVTDAPDTDGADPQPDRGAGPTGARLTAAGRTDALDAALTGLGRRLADADGEALAREVRALLQALSSRGHLFDAARPARAHAVRRVLATLLRELAAEGAPVLRASLDGRAAAAADAGDLVDGADATRTVLAALRAGSPREARVALQRARQNVADGERLVLTRLAEASTPRPTEPARLDRAGAWATGAAEDAGLRPAPAGSLSDDGLLAPLRFGLMLLSEPSPRREVLRVRGPSTMPDGAGPRTGRDRTTAGAGDPVGRRGRRWPLVACVLLAGALLTLAFAQPLPALLLAAGASWLLLR